MDWPIDRFSIPGFRFSIFFFFTLLCAITTARRRAREEAAFFRLPASGA
jgi:hypothetical protein